nr:SDR family oxidoreductase [Sinorhizobium meliloti]
MGAAVVRRFAERGDTVVIADKNGEAAADLASSLGDKHLAISADVTRESEVVAPFDDCGSATAILTFSLTALHQRARLSCP